MAIEYAYGVIFSYCLSALIWVWMFLVHVRERNEYSFGGLLIAVGFGFTAYRCYLYYIVQGLVSTTDIMFSVYVSACTFSAGSIILALALRHVRRL